MINHNTFIIKWNKGKFLLYHCISLLSAPLVDTTISTEQNKAYQAFATAQPRIENSVNNLPPQGETDTYEQVEESTRVHASCDAKNYSEGVYEN